MDSPRPPSSSAPVRPVTARTWQALAAAPEAEPRRGAAALRLLMFVHALPVSCAEAESAVPQPLHC
jgi:hypothetical protein